MEKLASYVDARREPSSHGGDVKPRKPRKKKDPNEPKRPLTAFFVYAEEMRTNPPAGADAKQRSGKLGESWKAMTDEERKVCPVGGSWEDGHACGAQRVRSRLAGDSTLGGPLLTAASAPLQPTATGARCPQPAPPHPPHRRSHPRASRRCSPS